MTLMIQCSRFIEYKSFSYEFLRDNYDELISRIKLSTKMLICELSSTQKANLIICKLLHVFFEFHSSWKGILIVNSIQNPLTIHIHILQSKILLFSIENVFHFNDVRSFLVEPIENHFPFEFEYALHVKVLNVSHAF